MAHITIDTGSPTLRMTTHIHVISPVDTGQPTSSTLYLLHGAGDNASTWHRLTTIELYAAKYGCTVIMPEVNRSYYTDMEYGLDYFYYVTQELPGIVQRLFRLNDDPERTFVAGLSMGGYGALKVALTFPETYAKAVSLSGVTDIQQRLRDPNMETGMAKEMQAVFGTALQVKPDQDLYSLAAKRIDEGGPLPPVLCCCGTEDPFIGMNREFAEYMRKTPFDFKYVEGPGTHEWLFWEKHLKTAFDFLFDEKN